MSIADGYVLNVGLPTSPLGCTCWVPCSSVGGGGSASLGSPGCSCSPVSASRSPAPGPGDAGRAGPRLRRQLVLSYVVNNIADVCYSLWTAHRLADPTLMRWGTVASMMLAATILITVGVLVEKFPSWWPATIAAGQAACDLAPRQPSPCTSSHTRYRAGHAVCGHRGLTPGASSRADTGF